MGADHTVQALSAIHVMRETLVSPGQYITEGGNEPYSAVGDAAQDLDNQYEIVRNPVVRCASPGFFVQGSAAGVFGEICRFRVPIEHVGTGLDGSSTNREKLYCRVWARTTNPANAGRVLISCDADSATSSTFTNTTYQWIELGTIDVDDTVGADDPELILYTEGASGAAAILVQSIEVSWVNTKTSLEDGPYSNGWLPLSVARFSELHNGLCTEQLQRMLRDLRIFIARRRGGFIGSQAFTLPTSAAQTTNGQVTGMWVFDTEQRQFSSQVKVWVYVEGDETTAPLLNEVTVSMAGVSGSFAPAEGAPAWYSVTLTLPENRSERPIPRELIVSTESTTIQAWSCCAWWRDAGVLR